MERYYIVFEGQIQGVGFRSYCQLSALKHQLTGSVKNLDNSCVEVYYQGDKQNIFAAIKELKIGNLFIKVKDYQMKKVPLCEDEKSFIIVY